jgi:ABC-type multidrug transport system fused ATPase/permease subunit
MGVGARFLAPLKDRILFEHVSVDDKTGRPLLAGISAEIKAGSRVAVMGLDEEACLALVCLVPRLLDPSVGRVRIDGHDLRDVTLESLRAQVGTVLQSDLVFSDTVTANIALGDASFSLPRVIQAAKLAHAHHFIQNLKDGYDTVIGPLADVQLSRDEQYRIALARAILHDPSILIIEEPSTPLDDTIKPLLDDTIDRIAQGRTLIFLPGRLSTVRKCDQVLVLQNGAVAAFGPPRQLMKDSQLFRHLQYVNFHKFATGEVEVGQMEG